MPRWPSPEERFWSKIQQGDGCWPWTGSKALNGYGKFLLDGKHVSAHRWAWENRVGPIPEGLTLDHLCRNRACVNPAHLEPVTIWENILRGTGPTSANSRKTHCIRGHEFTPENTIRKHGWRACRACKNLHAKGWYARKTAA